MRENLSSNYIPSMDWKSVPRYEEIIGHHVSNGRGNYGEGFSVW